MRYLDLVLYAFVKIVIWYSAVLLASLVAVEVATCPAQNRFVKSDLSGVTYVCDRHGAIARSNAALRRQPRGPQDPQIKPHSMGDDLRWRTVALVAG
jgi:hypothetical protein